MDHPNLADQMYALKDEDYNSATIDELFGTANTVRATCLRARYPWLMQRYKGTREKNPFSASTATNPALSPKSNEGVELHNATQNPAKQESIAQGPTHQEPALPPVHCLAPNCDYSTPMGAHAGTALELLKITSTWPTDNRQHNLPLLPVNPWR